jgi:hypothetical protein
MSALTPEQLERLLGDFARLVERRVRTRRDMTAEQYANLAAALYARAPCALLVFGCGEDSALWTGINRAGRTLFLEDKGEWAARGREQGLDVLDVRYESSIGQWMSPVRGPSGAGDTLVDTPWDLVLVDGPVGHGGGPGREQSVYLAGLIRARHGTLTFLHDFERTWERACAAKYLGDPSGLLGNLAWWDGARA